MTDRKNQSTPVELHKNERPSASQVDAGGLPIVSLTNGKNYYTENTLGDRFYEVAAHSGQPYPVVIWISGNTLQKMVSGICTYGPMSDCIYEPNFDGFGIWLKKNNESGSLLFQVYYVYGLPPVGNLLPTLVEEIIVPGSDIDSEEELILKLQTQGCRFPINALVGIAIAISPRADYSINHPIYIATQRGVGNDIKMFYPQQITPTTIDLTPAVIPAGIEVDKPMLRIYPTIERAIRTADAEGNPVKPAPFNIMGDLMNIFGGGVDDEFYVNGQIAVTERNISGIPRAGRIRRVRFEISSANILVLQKMPTEVILKLYRKQVHFHGDRHEIWQGSIIVPQDSYAGSVTGSYFEFRTLHLTKLGLREGMFITNGTSLAVGYIYRIEEGMDLIAGVLTPITRVWSHDIVSVVGGNLAWNVGEVVTFDIFPRGNYIPSFQWVMDIPYYTYWEDTPICRIYYETYVLGGIKPESVEVRSYIHIEEDNILIRCNPSRAVGGSEDLSKRW